MQYRTTGINMLLSGALFAVCQLSWVLAQQGEDVLHLLAQRNANYQGLAQGYPFDNPNRENVPFVSISSVSRHPLPEFKFSHPPEKFSTMIRPSSTLRPPVHVRPTPGSRVTHRTNPNNKYLAYLAMIKGLNRPNRKGGYLNGKGRPAFRKDIDFPIPTELGTYDVHLGMKVYGPNGGKGSPMGMRGRLVFQVHTKSYCMLR